MDFIELFKESFPSLLAGLTMTLRITVIALVIATFIGLIFGLINVGRIKWLKVIAKIYIDIIRGTPLIVQAFFIYFGLPNALNFKINAVVAGIIAVSLNAGAYMAEIFRAGIFAVDEGQMEAARSLGLPYGIAMRKVILPQAFRNMIPALVNQFIISLKDTSILSVIGITELTQSGEIIIAQNFQAFKMWIIVALFYFVIIEVLSTISKKVERCLL